MAKENKTQIEVSLETRKKLTNLKLIERDSYDAVIQRLLDGIKNEQLFNNKEAILRLIPLETHEGEEFDIANFIKDDRFKLKKL